MVLGRVLAVQAREQVFGGGAAHGGAVHGDRGGGQLGLAAQLEIPEAADREVLGDADAQGARAGDGAVGHEVGGGRVLDPQISYVVKNRMEQMIQHLADQREDLDGMRNLERFAALVMPLPLGLNLWKVQNTYWEMLQRVFPEFRQRADSGDAQAKSWVEQFLSLGERLGFAVPAVAQAAPLEMAA